MRPLALALGIILATACPAFARAAAMSEAWIDHAPTAAQVFHDIKGTDEVDTRARQAAAFDILISAIQEWEGALDWRYMSRRAAAKEREYLQAARNAPYGLKFDDATCKGHACVRWRFATGRSSYGTSLDFTRSLLRYYFPQEYVTAEINWKITGRIDGVSAPSPTTAPNALDKFARDPERGSQAWEQRRSTPFWWERLPALEQILADTKDGDLRVQSTIRVATLSAVLGVFGDEERKEGPWYVMPGPVKAKIAALQQARDGAYKEACPPRPAKCEEHFFPDVDKLHEDQGFKSRVSALYFGDSLKARLGARWGLFLTEQSLRFWWLPAILPLVIGVGVIVFFGWLVLAMRRARGPGPLSDNFGTASFAALQPWPTSPTVTADGVFLGKSSAPEWRNAELDAVAGAPMVSTPEHHTLIVARTRTGKGTRVIVPTLLRYAGNAFVIDPKGENAAITARTRRDTLSQTVHVLNPWGVLAKVYEGYGLAPATYNPLDILRRDDPNAVAIAGRLAAAICPVSGRGDDAFWQQSAARILTAIFLWLTDYPGETKTLARAREIVTLGRTRFEDEFLPWMEKSGAFGGAIKELIGDVRDLADNTYTGINASLTLATSFISDPQLKKATNTSTFSMSELRDKKTTLYLVIPPDQVQTQKTWLRLLIAAATHGFRSSAGETPAQRCMMLIDEFPALGKLQDLPADIATMAGHGLDYTLVVQGIDQLKATYEKDSGAILNNCAYKWFCNVTDLEGAKHLSELLGEATVRTVSEGESRGADARGRATRSESVNYGEKGRKLLTTDEIINLGRDVAIALRPDGLPMYLKPIDYWSLEAAFSHLAALPQYVPLYWRPPLSCDENPYFKKTAPPPGGSGSGPGSGSKSKSESKSEGKKRSDPPPHSKGGMTESEAREILGVAADATDDDIRAAYKRLMLKVHPDAGGTNYFARQLNEARTVLLGK